MILRASALNAFCLLRLTDFIHNYSGNFHFMPDVTYYSSLLVTYYEDYVVSIRHELSSLLQVNPQVGPLTFPFSGRTIYSPPPDSTVPVPCSEWSSQTANPSCFFLLLIPSPAETPCPKKEATNTAYVHWSGLGARAALCKETPGHIRAECH